MTRSHVPLLLAHLLGNALLLWLAYYWLGLSESDGPHLAWSALVLLLFSLAALWLHGAAFALFDRRATLNIRGAARRVLRHLLPLLVVAVTVAMLYFLLAHWYNAFAHSAFVIGSAATMTLRKPVPPSRVLTIFHAIIWLFRWLIIPALALPLAARISSEGWSAFHWRSFRLAFRPLYALKVVALLLCAVWLPLRLINWVPDAPAFGWQMASFLARLIVGYLLFVCAALALEFFSAPTEKPAES